MGMIWIRLGEIVETATREMTDVISIKLIDAKASKFEYYTMPFSIAANDDWAMAA
jgi:hypothetical protein